MLAIQPSNFAHNSSGHLSFKGDSTVLDKQAYNEKKNFYRNQIKECDEILDDNYVPKTMKKGVKIAKVTSEGVLDGWAVTWAALQGTRMAKSSVVKALNSKFIQGTKEIFKPLGKGIKAAGVNLIESLKKGIHNVKESKFVTKITNSVTKLEERMNKSSLGRGTVKVIKAIGKGLKAVGNLISKVAQKIAAPFKKVTYDSAAKTTATTLGIGSGLAGAYNAATRDDKTDNNIKKDKTQNIEQNRNVSDAEIVNEIVELDVAEDEE